jgi:2-methylisocitrate lyase-like PEP mutase family enzyme
VASARAVAALPQCRAVATASAAIAAAHGYPDGEVIPADLMLDAVARIAAAVELPVTADLEAGYGDVDRTVRRAVQSGVVGANLEDAMRPMSEAVTAVAAAVRAAAAEGVPLVLNARTDCYLDGEGRPPEAVLAEAVERGGAFLDAGADCVFVPGCADEDAIARLAERFGPGRLSVFGMPGMPAPPRLAELGAARVSYGPYPHRHALAALTDLAAGLLPPPPPRSNGSGT